MPSFNSSSASSVSQKSTMMRLPSLGLCKPQITIKLNEVRNTYSTLDKIAGKVIVTASSCTRFDRIDIQFLGASKTFVEKLQTTPGMPTSNSAFHNFLKLTQPISESSYPQPRLLEAGRTYEFPFLFVVPQHLLPRICNHVAQHESVRDLHLQLPPSLGGHGDYEGWVGPQQDDFAPDMANISYHIAVKVQDECSRTMAIKTKAVDIIPNFDEQPPVDVDGPESDYHLRKEKTIKKGLFKGKLGSLVMESDQPKSLCLPVDHCRSSVPVSTSTVIRLRFDPLDGKIPPPKLANLSSKIKVNTWYADQGRSIIPNKKSIQYDYHQGNHSEFVSLSSRSMENVEWKFHRTDSTPALNRRDSAMSDSSLSRKMYAAASEKYQGSGFYTAEIIVPVTLPTNKRFTPTFHSCLISRTYALYLSLSVQGGTMTAPSVELKLPIQVSTERKSHLETSSPRSSLTVAEQVEEARIADEFFVARTISPLDQSLVGNSNITGVPTEIPSDLPPQYDALVHVAHEVRASA